LLESGGGMAPKGPDETAQGNALGLHPHAFCRP
jgi:hypothetical protein